MMCIICGAISEKPRAHPPCSCRNDLGITAAARQLLDTIRSGDWSPRHKAAIVAAEERLRRAQAEARQR